MDKIKLGQEPAFPIMEEASGISKRFYAACAAMQGILANDSLVKTIGNLCSGSSNLGSSGDFSVSMAYKIADKLLEQEFDQPT
jgi:hypothetical protein